jgi:hypothetical protein
MAVSRDLGWLAFDIGAKTHTWACDIGGIRETGKVDNTPAELVHGRNNRTAASGFDGK